MYVPCCTVVSQIGHLHNFVTKSSHLPQSTIDNFLWLSRTAWQQCEMLFSPCRKQLRVLMIWFFYSFLFLNLFCYLVYTNTHTHTRAHVLEIIQGQNLILEEKQAIWITQLRSSTGHSVRLKWREGALR